MAVTGFPSERPALLPYSQQRRMNLSYKSTAASLQNASAP